MSNNFFKKGVGDFFFFYSIRLEEAMGKLSVWTSIFILHVCVCSQVEFEWLRQYWFQGQRYTRFCSWWTRPMEQLEKDWRLMETMVRPFRRSAGHMAAVLSGFLARVVYWVCHQLSVTNITLLICQWLN